MDKTRKSGAGEWNNLSLRQARSTLKEEGNQTIDEVTNNFNSMMRYWKTREKGSDGYVSFKQPVGQLSLNRHAKTFYQHFNHPMKCRKDSKIKPRKHTSAEINEPTPRIDDHMKSTDFSNPPSGLLWKDCNWGFYQKKPGQTSNQRVGTEPMHDNPNKNSRTFVDTDRHVSWTPEECREPNGYASLGATQTNSEKIPKMATETIEDKENLSQSVDAPQTHETENTADIGIERQRHLQEETCHTGASKSVSAKSKPLPPTPSENKIERAHEIKQLHIEAVGNDSVTNTFGTMSLETVPEKFRQPPEQTEETTPLRQSTHSDSVLEELAQMRRSIALLSEVVLSPRRSFAINPAYESMPGENEHLYSSLTNYTADERNKNQSLFPNSWSLPPSHVPTEAETPETGVSAPPKATKDPNVNHRSGDLNLLEECSTKFTKTGDGEKRDPLDSDEKESSGFCAMSPPSTHREEETKTPHSGQKPQFFQKSTGYRDCTTEGETRPGSVTYNYHGNVNCTTNNYNLTVNVVTCSHTQEGTPVPRHPNDTVNRFQ